MNMVDNDIMEDILEQLLALEEVHFLAGFHQQVQKAQEKAWLERHIKQRTFTSGDLVLMYDSKFTEFPSKFKMHWLVTYIIRDISYGGTVQLAKVNEELIVGKVDGSRLKIYRDDSIFATA